MSYATKDERRQRKELLRTLAREQAQFVKKMAELQEYSGRTYLHQVDDLRAITDRIVSVYLKGEAND